MRARIYQPAKTAMQSGTGKSKGWVLEFAPAAAREVDPLMGWTSSGDTQSQVKLRFETQEAALAYAAEHGIEADVTLPKPRKANIRPGGYGENFATGRKGAWTHWMPMISRESPLGADLALLMERHTADMHAETPPESIHMMDASALAVPEVAFFVMREEGRAIGMGAFKRLNADHAEIKSMHVLAEVRGRGLSKAMLTYLEAEARKAGITRLSLETGAEPIFVPARELYLRAGYAECPPFANYAPDPHSVFMTKTLV